MKNTQAGFSLAEILVTIAIGGVLTALAVPNLVQMSTGYRLRGATHEIFTALQRARMAAIKENNRYRFSISGSTYSIHSDLDNDGTVDSGETVTAKNITDTARDVSLSSDTAIVFAANGTAVISGSVILSNGNQTKTVSVSVAGRVKIDS